MKPKAEFIFFDLGNVILNFDYGIGCRKVSELTGVTEDEIRKTIYESSLQSEFEKGLLDSNEFLARFVASSGGNADDQLILQAVSDIFWLNRAIVPVLAQLRVIGMPMGILSNTCSAHWQFVQDRFPILTQSFKPELCILSYETRAMKPEVEIYQRAIAAAGVDPSGIFFTDDRCENIAGARQSGLQAETYESVPTLTRQLAERGVLLNL